MSAVPTGPGPRTTPGTPPPRTNRQAVVGYMRAALVAEQAHRNTNTGVYPDGEGGYTLGWVLAERECMVGSVAAARSAYGLPPVPRTAVLAAERRAEGHADYTAKYALYCAGLATDTGEGM